MGQIKRRLYKTAILSLLALTASPPLTGQEVGMDAFGIESIELHIEITSLRTAAPPRVVEDKVLFTYRPSDRTIAGRSFTRYVGVAFAHENFSTVHVFARNEHGVFFLLYPIPTEGALEILEYRYVVDGLWLADPENPNQVVDVAGIPISYVRVPTPTPDRGELPHVGTDGRVRFVYRGDEDALVSLAGTFTNWDPYMYRLTETSPGEYEITLRLQPDTYAYYFVVNGRRELDPLNPELAYDADGNPASRVVVPPTVALDDAAR